MSMRIIKRTDSSITPHSWVLSLIKNISLNLDGQSITLRISNKPAHAGYLLLAKGLLGPTYLDKIDPKDLNGIKIEEVSDQSNPKDLLVKVDYSNYVEPNPLNLSGLRKLFRINVKDVSFNDWNTTGNIDIRWLEHGLGIRIPFESKDHEVSVKKLGFTVKGNIDGFYLDVHLVPYIFWFPNIVPARDKSGKELVNPTTNWPKELWAGGRGMYKQRCSVFVDFGWSSFSPDIMDAEDKAKGALDKLAKGIPGYLPQDVIAQLFEVLILGERDLANLKGPSTLRGVDIHPNDAEFLFLDNEVEYFKGKGKIVAVRKDNTPNHLSENALRKDLIPDTIVEVEVEEPGGKRVRMSTLNLVESILDGDAVIENAHAVIRRAQPWGTVADVNVPWKGLISRQKDMFGNWGAQGGMAELRYNGYLRSNPDSSSGNNLDNLPTYSYDTSQPLFKNIYDGTFFFIYADLTAFSGLQRTLFPRAWKIPSHDDRKVRLLDTWIGY